MSISLKQIKQMETLIATKTLSSMGRRKPGSGRKVMEKMRTSMRSTSTTQKMACLATQGSGTCLTRSTLAPTTWRTSRFLCLSARRRREESPAVAKHARVILKNMGQALSFTSNSWSTLHVCTAWWQCCRYQRWCFSPRGITISSPVSMSSLPSYLLETSGSLILPVLKECSSNQTSVILTKKLT